MSDTYGSGIYGTALYGATIAPPAWTGVTVGGSPFLPQLDVQIDLTLPTDNVKVWTSIVSKVRSCMFARSGRNDEFQRTSPGTITLLLDNRNDAITSLGVKKAQWVRVLALWASTQVELGRFVLTSVPRQWSQAGHDATVTLQGAGPLYLLRLFDLGANTGASFSTPPAAFPLQRCDQRIQDICNRVSSPVVSPLVGTLDVNTDTIDATAVPALGSDALSAVLAIEASDNGLLVEDLGGTISYQGRHYRILNSQTSVLTLSDTSGASYHDDVTLEDDDSRLANIVAVSPLGGGPPQFAGDTASQSLYWTRRNQTADRQLLANNAALAQACAQYLVGRYRDPPPRIPTVTVDLANVGLLAPSTMLTLLGLRNSQRVTWQRNAPTPISLDGYVEQISHTIDPNAQWTVALQLSPATLEQQWVLGTHQLGISTVLTY